MCTSGSTEEGSSSVPPRTNSKPDALRAAVVARRVDRDGRALDDRHSVGRDEQVDDERSPGLALAVPAVTAVHEHRLGLDPIADRAARAPAFANAHARHVRPVTTAITTSATHAQIRQSAPGANVSQRFASPLR
jgi:hypothetical protein